MDFHEGSLLKINGVHPYVPGGETRGMDFRGFFPTQVFPLKENKAEKALGYGERWIGKLRFHIRDDGWKVG